jgi:uncharacterized DUF497 family protein
VWELRRRWRAVVVDATTVVRLFEDQKHSVPGERRYILYGRGLESRVLIVGFTLRAKRVRIITARPASRRERRIYEKRS